MKWYGFAFLFLILTFFDNYFYAVRLDFTSSQTALIPENMTVPDVSLDRLDGKGVLNAVNFPKQPLILFFFGSWCRPCRAELPLIMEISKQRQVPFLAVAVHDKPEQVKMFFKKTGNPYLIVGLDPDLKWARALNSGVVPTALIFNAQGKAVARIKGLLTPEFYTKTVVPYLKGLENEDRP